MTRNLKSILILIGIGLLLYGLWFFRDIILYIIISVVISIIGGPIVNLLGKLRIRKFQLPKWLCAIFALLVILAFFAGVISIFGPLVADEAVAFSKIDVEKTAQSLEGSIAKTEEWLSQFNFSGDDRSNREYMLDQLKAFIDFSRIGNAFSNIFGILGNAFVAVFSIIFIAFFFLKDSNLFEKIVYTATPDKYQEEARNIMTNTNRLLTRYFFGLLAQITIYTIVISSGLAVVGVENAILIGFLAGLFNLIPYLGPIIGGVIGLVIAFSSNLEMAVESMLPFIFKVAAVFIGGQLLDNMVVQPYIFSNSVKAHPLEIFLVISIAGTLAGIPGMILAIPGYTFIRIVAKEFLSEFKIVESLTKNI